MLTKYQGPLLPADTGLCGYGNSLEWCMGDNITLSEWQKSQTLTMPDAGEGMEQQELSFLAGWHNGMAPLDDSLEVSYKTKHTISIYQIQLLSEY